MTAVCVCARACVRLNVCMHSPICECFFLHAKFISLCIDVTCMETRRGSCQPMWAPCVQILAQGCNVTCLCYDQPWGTRRHNRPNKSRPRHVCAHTQTSAEKQSRPWTAGQAAVRRHQGLNGAGDVMSPEPEG